MTKMFTYKGLKMKTWNPWTGCLHDCYNGGCWAKKLIETRLKNTPKYKICGFKPTFHKEELNKTFNKNDFVFISSLGDISFAPKYVVREILDKIRENPQTKFLFCTKNPSIYDESLISEEWNLENLYLGCTIETNRDTSKFSKAPSPEFRYNHMIFQLQNKFLSIEPIMDFDVYEFTKMIIDIEPKIVEVGADNYKSGLPEPSSEKIKLLINSMESNGIEVVKKQGLERLLKE